MYKKHINYERKWRLKNIWNVESLQSIRSLENERKAHWPRFQDKLFNSGFCLVPVFSGHQLSFNHIHTFTHQHFFWDNCLCFLIFAQILNAMPTFPNCCFLFVCLFSLLSSLCYFAQLWTQVLCAIPRTDLVPYF